MTKKKHEPVDTTTGEILVGLDQVQPLADTTDTAAVTTTTRITRFTSNYRHDRTRSQRFATNNTLPSLTQQSDADETDINIIVKKYVKGAGLPNVTQQPIYGDFTGDGYTYREMVEKIQAADAAFQEIPADIRGRFENDPNRWMQFVNDPKNIDELRRMGLAEPEKTPAPPPEPMLVRVVQDPPPQ